MKNRWIILVLLTLLFVVVISLALAKGKSEELGPPTIDIAQGNGMVAAGTGMVNVPGVIEPGPINFSIPEEVTIKQVLLYWEGRMGGMKEGDQTIVVNGTEVTGELIGGPTEFCETCSSSSFRADITNLGLVASGDNTLTLSGFDFDVISNGAGVLVLYKGSGEDAEIELFDGLDLAYEGWTGDRNITVPQNFTFSASPKERKAKLSLFVSSIIPFDAEEGTVRPNSIEVTIGDGEPQLLSDLLSNSDGFEWDTVNLEDITIPAGAESLKVQIFSRDDSIPPREGLKAASLTWIAAALMVPPGDGPPGLEVSKNCTPVDVFVGDGIDYEFIVRNTGNENLIDIVVEDSHLGRIAEIDSLPVNELRTIKETWIPTEAGVITNTAWATGTIASSLEPIESNISTAECNVYELEVTKEPPQTSLIRRYNWNINKWVKASKEAEFKESIDHTVFPGQVFYPIYKVVVNSSPSDSNWAVSGTISVTNPAPIDASLESVTDVLSDPEIFHQYLPVISKSGESQNAGVDQNQPNHITLPGIPVPVSCPSLTVPAGETLVCTYGPVDLLSGSTRTNTAYATLENRVSGVISGTTVFSGTTQIDFDSAKVEEIDKEVMVVDQREGEDDKRTLGTANVDYDELPKAFPEYDLPVLPPFSTEECEDLEKRNKKVPNTATFTTNDTGTQGRSSAEVNLFCIVSASTGFEDLPLDEENLACQKDPKDCNDWDYNDAFFEVFFDDPLPTFSPSNDLKKITFQLVQPVNCSANTHEFHIQPPFVCDGTYSLTRRNYKDYKEEVINGDYKSGQDLTIFDDTLLGDPDPVDYCTPKKKQEPPGFEPPPPPPLPNTAKLVIEFDVPSPGACPLDLSRFDPIGTFNGEGLFYAPSLVVKAPSDKPENWYTIKPSAENEEPEPRIVGVPDTWIWPYENQCIWAVYPDIKPTTDPKGPPLFKPLWWTKDKYKGPNQKQCPPWPLEPKKID